MKLFYVLLITTLASSATIGLLKWVYEDDSNDDRKNMTSEAIEKAGIAGLQERGNPTEREVLHIIQGNLKERESIENAAKTAQEMLETTGKPLPNK